VKRSFVLKAAEELMDEEFAAKWRDRQRIGRLPRIVLGTVLTELLSTGQPVTLDTVVAALRHHARADVEQAVWTLDEKDMIVVRDDRIVLAYPFTAAPSAFTLLLPDGRIRYAVCAVDALGVAAMLGQPVKIRSVCYHCQERLELAVQPDGPRGGHDVMVWVGERAALRARACTSLCLTINFFRSEEHLAAWHGANPEVPGAAATVLEATALGAAIFGKLLRDLVASSSAWSAITQVGGPAPGAEHGFNLTEEDP